ILGLPQSANAARSVHALQASMTGRNALCKSLAKGSERVVIRSHVAKWRRFAGAALGLEDAAQSATRDPVTRTSSATGGAALHSALRQRNPNIVKRLLILAAVVTMLAPVVSIQ